MKYFPMDELDFKPIEFEEFTFQVSECIDYVEQLLKRAKSPKEPLSVEERDASPALAFTALVRAYSQAAPSAEYYREQLAAQSEPGATAERFAGVSAASYHEVALEIVRAILSAVADVCGILFADSMRPSKEGGLEGYQVFLPDTDQLPVDRPACMNRLAEFPSFDAPRLRAFLDKEAARLRSAPPDAHTAGSSDHNETPKSKTGITTLADCAYRFNQLCRSDRDKAEARRLVAEIQAAHHEHTQGESDWQKRRRHYFEQTAMEDDDLLDDASHYKASDLHWMMYKRDALRGEIENLPRELRERHFNPLPHHYPENPMLPSEQQKAGRIEITAWTSTEFLPCNSPKPLCPLPPENIGRAYRFPEIVTALVAVHDADGRFEPIVPEDDPICKHWLFQTFLVGDAKDRGNDDWAPGLEPLLERVEAKWSKLVESDKEVGDPCSPPRKPKRSTETGEARIKLIAALTKHHKYADGSCLNQKPIGNNELARKAGVDKATASAFFEKNFKGHSKYKALCWNDKSGLIAALKILNQEFSPYQLYGAKPPGGDEGNGKE